MTTDGIAGYEERLGRVTAYIYDHLEDEIDLRKLADIACLSPYHWHRIYHAVQGETIAAAVRRLRLHRAAGYLAQTNLSIEAIAGKSGYGSVPAFARSFKASFGLPPARFRKEGSHARFRPVSRQRGQAVEPVEIREIAELSLVCVEHRGSYMKIGRAFDTLYARLGARGLLRPGLRSIAIFDDDPAATAEPALRSRACVVMAGAIAIDPPLGLAPVTAGPYAVLRHKGPYADMRAAYDWLFGQWLPSSGREPADAPVFEEYLNSPRDTAPAELLTEICLPLRPEVGS
jgi:AraC family transcriptional regulator